MMNPSCPMGNTAIVVDERLTRGCSPPPSRDANESCIVDGRFARRQDPDDPEEAVESRPSTAMTAGTMEDETKEQRWNPRMQGFAHHTARTGFLEGEMALPRHDATPSNLP